MNQIIESLESRRLLAVTTSLAEGVLSIDGTDGNDGVYVTESSRAGDDFTVRRGVTSVSLDTGLLAAAASLELTGADGTARARGGFDVGFRITGGGFTYSAENGITPLGGQIEHSGSVTFNDGVTVGDFTIGFDAARATGDASGFFVEDTIGGLGILFDVSAPERVTAGPRLRIAGSDLLVSPEFAGFLSDNGLASTDLTGADVGDAQVNARSVSERVTTVKVFDFQTGTSTFDKADVQGIVADLGDGRDRLIVTGVDADLDVSLGGGNDHLFVSGGGGTGVFDLGDGDDSAFFFNSTLTGTIDGGAGDDVLTLFRTELAGDDATDVERIRDFNGFFRR